MQKIATMGERVPVVAIIFFILRIGSNKSYNDK
jgi:hypothetical protein